MGNYVHQYFRLYSYCTVVIKTYIHVFLYALFLQSINYITKVFHIIESSQSLSIKKNKFIDNIIIAELFWLEKIPAGILNVLKVYFMTMNVLDAWHVMVWHDLTLFIKLMALALMSRSAVDFSLIRANRLTQGSLPVYTCNNNAIKHYIRVHSAQC